MEKGKLPLEDMRYRDSWIPETSYVPILPKPAPIYSDMQLNQMNQTNWSQSGRVFSMENIPGTENMRFMDLLALAGAAPKIQDTSAGASSSNPYTAHIMGESSSGACGPTQLYGPNRWLADYNLPENSKHELQASCMHLYNLNYHPEKMVDIVDQSTRSQLAPITPQKTIEENATKTTIQEKVGNKVEVAAIRLTNDELKYKSAVAPSEPQGEEFGPDKGGREVTDSSAVAPSEPQGEEFGPEKGGREVTDSSAVADSGPKGEGLGPNKRGKKVRTPHDKLRKIKVRPKVFKDGKTRKRKTPAPKVSESTEKPKAKRKYVRKKGVNKDSTALPEEGGGELSDSKTRESAKRTCKKRVNFDLQDENSTCKAAPSLPSRPVEENCYKNESQSKPTQRLSDATDVVVERQQTRNPSDHLSMNQDLKQYISPLERQPPVSPLLPKSKPCRTRARHSPSNIDKIERVCGGLTEHNEQQDLTNIMLRQHTRLREGSSNNNNGTAMTPMTQARGSKREYPVADGQIENGGSNVNGVHYNNLQAFKGILDFPNIYRKKRSEKGQNFTTASTSSSMKAGKHLLGQGMFPLYNSPPDSSAPKGNYSSSSRSNATLQMPTTLGESGQGIARKCQTLDCITFISQTNRPTKKRSRSTTRGRDVASLTRIIESYRQPTNVDGQLRLGCDRQAFSKQSTWMRKKRTEKSHSLDNAASFNQLEMRERKNHQHQHHELSSSVKSTPDVLWKQMLFVESITEQMKLLDINREQNALVPYMMKSTEQNALVLHRKDGTVVPFNGSFKPIKKQRPKVDLDDETNRVWNLLLDNIDSEGVDGTSEHSAKWWENERMVFQGRADSFIARMHLIQGDRRFSPWKGSVLDSVVGVFLTQNVSDHLSSSAFMSLASAFPFKSFCNSPCHEEGGSSVTHEPIVYVVEPEETISVPIICDQASATPGNTERSEDNENFNSNGISRSKCESIGNVVKPSLNAFKTFDPDVERSKIEAIGIEAARASEDMTPIHDTYSSQDSIHQSQNSVKSVTSQVGKKTWSGSESSSEAEGITKGLKLSNMNAPTHTSFVELLQMTMQKGLYRQENNNYSSNSVSKDGYIQGQATKDGKQRQTMDDLSQKNSPLVPIISYSSYSSGVTSKLGVLEIESFESSREETRSSSGNNLPSGQDEDVIAVTENEMLREDKMDVQSHKQVANKEIREHINLENHPRSSVDVTGSNSSLDSQINIPRVAPKLDLKDLDNSTHKDSNDTNAATSKSRGKKVFKVKNDAATSKSTGKKVPKEKKNPFDWDSLRKQVEETGIKRERTTRTSDTVDWEAVRSADVNKVAETIRERGMNNVLAGRIKDFLDRIVKDHGSLDLEWLRDIPPDKAKEYLLSVRGLGLKSVECVRLLTLHHLAFPVDTNVGRIAVRLGWVPLQPLPESLQLHLLELYPILETIQKYLWPRLCKLDQKTLYELHYQLITFGKVFCTKSKPNCNSCPMRGECRHFASAFASARLALPGPEEKSMGMSGNSNVFPEPVMTSDQRPSLLSKPNLQLGGEMNSEAKSQSEGKTEASNFDPIVEEPASPEPEHAQVCENDIEDAFWEDPDEIPTIKLNLEAFTKNLQSYMQDNMELQECDMSKALVALTAQAASIPTPKLKSVSRLRTEHQVYELPDSHPLLKELEDREPDDPSRYLLAIWTPGETPGSIQQPETRCSSQEKGTLCNEETCFACNSVREENSQIVRGTILIPCRTAMRGSFPLNGTYFQVNEVFADHDSSLNPIAVPREWIWNLPRKTVYFGTSIPSIFKGLTTEGIQHCFWRGYICVRGFDRKTRAPRPLMARLHFPASKLSKTKQE